MENRAFNMDCLEAMRSMPDQCFDLAVVDPPYGVGSVTYMPRTREKAHGGFIDKYNISLAALALNYVAEFATDKCRFIAVPGGQEK